MAKKRIKNELAVVFGPEPVLAGVALTDENYKSVLGDALRWYGQYGGAPNGQSLTGFHKAWLSEWAVSAGFSKSAFAIPNQGIRTLGSLARLALKGFPFEQKHLQKLTDAICKWKPAKKEPVDKAALGRLLTLKAKIKNEEALKPILTIFDEAIDSVMGGAKEWKVNAGRELNGKQTYELFSMYKRDLKELRSAYNKTDPELVEAYPLSRLTLRRLVQIHEDILEEIEACGNRGKVMKTARAPRKKKIKPASVHVKNLQFMPVDTNIGIASVEPEKLVGASLAYIFDTKKRLLKRLEATGIAGIEVHGTTLKNITGKQRTIRKPKEFLPGFATKTKLQSDKEFGEIRAKEKDCTGRLNKDIIILRVF